MANICSVALRVDGDELDVHEFLYKESNSILIEPPRAGLGLNLTPIGVYECTEMQPSIEDAEVIRSYSAFGWSKGSFDADAANRIFGKYKRLTFIVESDEAGNGVFMRDVFIDGGHSFEDMESLRDEDYERMSDGDDDDYEFPEDYSVFTEHPHDIDIPSADAARYKHPIFMELLKRNFSAVKARIDKKTFNPRVTQGAWTPSMVAAHLGQLDLVERLRGKEYHSEEQVFLMRNILLFRHLRADDDRWLPLLMEFAQKYGLRELLDSVSSAFNDSISKDNLDPRMCALVDACLDRVMKLYQEDQFTFSSTGWTESVESALLMMAIVNQDKLDAWLNNLEAPLQKGYLQSLATSLMLNDKVWPALSCLDRLSVDDQREAVFNYVDSLSARDFVSAETQPMLLQLDMRFDDFTTSIIQDASMLSGIVGNYAIKRTAADASEKMAGKRADQNKMRRL